MMTVNDALCDPHETCRCRASETRSLVIATILFDWSTIVSPPRVLHVNRPFLEPTNKKSRQPILIILKRYNHGNKFLETTRHTIIRTNKLSRQPRLILKRHNHGNTFLDTTRHTIIRTNLPANHNRCYHSKMETSSLIYTMRKENFMLLLCTTNIPQRHMS
jgi:hypothetical protein